MRAVSVWPETTKWSDDTQQTIQDVVRIRLQNNVLVWVNSQDRKWTWDAGVYQWGWSQDTTATVWSHYWLCICHSLYMEYPPTPCCHWCSRSSGGRTTVLTLTTAITTVTKRKNFHWKKMDCSRTHAHTYMYYLHSGKGTSTCICICSFMQLHCSISMLIFHIISELNEGIVLAEHLKLKWVTNSTRTKMAQAN